MEAPSRSPAERLAAWLVTGPVGHLWSVVADLVLFVLREWWKKARRAFTLSAGSRGRAGGGASAGSGSSTSA